MITKKIYFLLSTHMRTTICWCCGRTSVLFSIYETEWQQIDSTVGPDFPILSLKIQITKIWWCKFNYFETFVCKISCTSEGIIYCLGSLMCIFSAFALLALLRRLTDQSEKTEPKGWFISVGYLYVFKTNNEFLILTILTRHQVCSRVSDPS